MELHYLRTATSDVHSKTYRGPSVVQREGNQSLESQVYQPTTHPRDSTTDKRHGVHGQTELPSPMLDPREPDEIYASIRPDPPVSCPRYNDVQHSMEAALASSTAPQSTELLVATVDRQDPGPTFHPPRPSTQLRRVHVPVLSGNDRRHTTHVILLSQETVLLAYRTLCNGNRCTATNNLGCHQLPPQDNEEYLDQTGVYPSGHLANALALHTAFSTMCHGIPPTLSSVFDACGG